MKCTPKIKYALFLLVFVSLNCENNNQAKVESEISKDKIIEKTVEIDKALLEIKGEIDSLVTYAQLKSSIRKIKGKLHKKTISEDSLAIVFEDILVGKIFPYWYGTKWSYGGHTSKPNEGEIACGYFVSTTLKDLGLNLNRYKLAKQGPINEAKTLAQGNELIVINEDTADKNIEAMKVKVKEGVHFIGFDEKHVGFLLKRKNDLYLIHADYWGANEVAIERIEKSETFSFFKKFYITELSTNKELLTKWVNNQKIGVVTD